VSSIRVITEPLGGSKLTKAFTDGSAPEDWYPALRSPEFLAANARTVAEEFTRKDWLATLRPAFGAHMNAASLQRLEAAAQNGVVITTGQQPGLFGGPMYTLSKALSALALADELQNRTSIPVAPVFWAATDDADFAESSSVIVPAGDSALELSVEKRDDIQRPLASEPLPEMQKALEDFLRGVGSSANAEIVEIAIEAYRAPTVGDAYVALLRGILEPLGISVLDAAHPAVRSAGHPLLISALQHADSGSKSLSDRNAAISAAGFKVQVREVKGRSLVFRYSDMSKERIPVAQAKDAASAAPGELSATVLLRPIMERAILPTAAYVAGPAEIGYFAQVSAVADALNAKQPNPVPRWSGTVIEPRVERILKRYKLEPRDFVDPHALESQKAREQIPESVQALVARLREAATQVERPDASLSALVSPQVLSGLHRDLSHRLDRFERRAAAAVKRQGSETLRDIEAARASLYPLGKPQERAVSFVALMARYGSELVEKMLAAARAHAGKVS
jgi:bacillithiol synthase